MSAVAAMQRDTKPIRRDSATEHRRVMAMDLSKVELCDCYLDAVSRLEIVEHLAMRILELIAKQPKVLG